MNIKPAPRLPSWEQAIIVGRPDQVVRDIKTLEPVLLVPETAGSHRRRREIANAAAMIPDLIAALTMMVGFQSYDFPGLGEARDVAESLGCDLARQGLGAFSRDFAARVFDRLGEAGPNFLCLDLRRHE